eukprot:scaffold1933_cov124-Pinguiococcus_pyrenoidosus.AAC.1
MWSFRARSSLSSGRLTVPGRRASQCQAGAPYSARPARSRRSQHPASSPAWSGVSAQGRRSALAATQLVVTSSNIIVSIARSRPGVNEEIQTDLEDQNRDK